MIDITVFTPTYNRAYTLPVLYESLCRQTVPGFEWLIVDDGSTDDTPQLVTSFIAEGKLDIRYVRTENGGKHRAINRGVALARGELFFIADSDDALPDDALRRTLRCWSGIGDKSRFAGVAGLKYTFDGRRAARLTSEFAVLDCSAMEFRFKYRNVGDVAEVYRTEVLRRFPFPEIEGETFVPEAVVWFRIAGRYILRYFNEPIYRCEYLPDGYSRNFRANLARNPRGFAIHYRFLLFASRIPLSVRAKSLARYVQCVCYALRNKIIRRNR